MHQILKFILEWNSTCFGQFPCPSSGVTHYTLSNGIRHTSLLTAFVQDQDGTAVPFWSCSKAVWYIPLLSVQWITPDDGQSNCPKHVEFHSKINLRIWCIYLVYYGEICRDARTHERKIIWNIFLRMAYSRGMKSNRRLRHVTYYIYTLLISVSVCEKISYLHNGLHFPPKETIRAWNRFWPTHLSNMDFPSI
jgi:hypothetical protein